MGYGRIGFGADRDWDSDVWDVWDGGCDVYFLSVSVVSRAIVRDTTNE